ncbi:O-Antigen ligase [Nocardioides dokdonensis FR1436]|uniref:O-Antigen ligase n=1 Tax=Nocardioides dokdonensis FR1436 TaxID=1300347 RepID=A0A1A9GRT7_9ACTN|nr:O-antigen ligase family protein [Nocardioides dokdonensis]ANH40215.1 O-Antigen ligase [Nocardioides dokdonensis FR1436]
MSGTDVAERPSVVARGAGGRRERRWPFVLVPALLALAGGLGVGLAPAVAGPVLVGVLALAVMLTRLEVALSLVVAASLFEDYLALVDPRIMKLLALLAFASWLVRRATGRLHGGPRTKALAAAGLLGVALLASAALNGTPDGGEVLLRWVGFLVLLLVLVDTMRAGRLAPRTLARVYVAASAVAAAAGIVSYTIGLDRRVGGPIGDPNDFAFFLLAALPLSLAVRRRGWRPSGWDLATVLITVALLGTFSRGALIGLAVVLLVAVLARQITLQQLTGLAGVLLVLAALVAAMFPDLVAESLRQKDAVADENITERLQLWQAAGEMALDAPLLGQGPGSFGAEHARWLEQLPVSATSDLDVAHQTYLEVAAEVGFIGLTAFLALLVAGLRGAWRAWRRDEDGLASAVFSALVGTIVAAVFLSEQFFLPLWLLVALGAVLLVDEPSPPAPED